MKFKPSLSPIKPSFDWTHIFLCAQHNLPSSVNLQVCVDFLLASGLRKARAQYVNGWGAVPAISKTQTVSGAFVNLSLGGLEPKWENTDQL